MGGPGSGRRGGAYAMGRYVAEVSGLSRVELEPWMASCLRAGDAPQAEAIRAELEARVWQWHNPYERTA